MLAVHFLSPTLKLQAKPTSFLEVTRKPGLGDLTFTAISLLIIIFLGLQLLWVGNAAWDSRSDYLAALLWGLARYQVSGAAF
jgi:hypothetical protein